MSKYKINEFIPCSSRNLCTTEIQSINSMLTMNKKLTLNISILFLTFLIQLGTHPYESNVNLFSKGRCISIYNNNSKQYITKGIITYTLSQPCLLSSPFSLLQHFIFHVIHKCNLFKQSRNVVTFRSMT